MRRLIFKILILAFVIFALLQNRHRKINIPVQEPPKYEFIDKIRSSMEVILSDPKSRSLTDINTPILQGNQEQLSIDRERDSFTDKNNNLIENDLSPRNESPSNTQTVGFKKINNKQDADITPKSWVERKISNIADNLLHTPQGQELLERFLLNKPDPGDVRKRRNAQHHNNSIIDVLQGEGKPAECGDVVKAHYIIRLVNGQEVENTHKLGEASTFQIGEQKVIKGLEYAVIGMKKGGVRRLVVPPKMAYNQLKFSKGLVPGNEFVTIDVTLLDIISPLSELDDKIRIFDNVVNDEKPSMLCSKQVFFYYTISTINNKVISTSNDLTEFVLGSSSVPPAINKAFSNIKRYSKRTVVMPSSLIYGQEISFLPPNLKLPSNEIIILDIDTNY